MAKKSAKKKIVARKSMTKLTKAAKPAKGKKPAKKPVKRAAAAKKKPLRKIKAPVKKAKAKLKKAKAPVKKMKSAAKRVAAKIKKAVPRKSVSKAPAKKKVVARKAAAKAAAPKKRPAPPKTAKAKPAPAKKSSAVKPADVKPVSATPPAAKPAPAPAAPKAAAAPAHDICWAELATNDLAAAKAFYTALFPWELSDSPIPGGSVYTMATLDDGPVCGLYTMQAEMSAQGVPPHWNMYVSTPDVDASARRIKELGGTVIAEPFDVMDVGRMAVAQDPAGATFCLWQARLHKGFAHADWRTGIVCWSELMSSDTDKAGAFYSKLFGWKQEPVEMTPGEKYTILATPEKQVAGMHPLPDELKAHGVPSNWLMYWTVRNCDATLEKARSLGATVLFGPQSMPGIGRFAAIQDPQGAAFAILQPD